MWCTVHTLFRKGKRLSNDVAQANPVSGWLYMHSKEPNTGTPDCCAYLLPARPVSTYAPILHAILQLDCCQLRTINGGILLRGVDLRPPGSWVVHRQAWLIYPGPDRS